MPSLDPNFGRVVPANVPLEAGDGWGRKHVGSPREYLHQGLDIRLPTGTPILAAAGGLVVHASTKPDPEAGNFVAVLHPDGLTSRYLHLSKVLVSTGARVARGQELGRSGSTGRSDAPHLHFDLWAPDRLLPQVIQEVGKPTTGFGSRLRYGVAIPSEPWLPVDSYAAGVVSRAAQHQIPLRRDRGAPLVAQEDGAIDMGAFDTREPLVRARPVIIGAGIAVGVIGLLWLTSRAARRAAW